MKFIIQNDENDEMVSLMFQELEQILKKDAGVKNITIHKYSETGKKCFTTTDIVITLVLGVGSGFIWDTLKGIITKYKNRSEYKKNTKITIKEGDKTVTLEIDEVSRF